MGASMKNWCIVAAAALAAWTLAVPPAAAVNPPGLESYDHFMCYQVKDVKKRCLEDPALKCKSDADCATVCYTGFPKDVAVSVADQFESGQFDVKKPKELCLPANKDNEDPGAEQGEGHLKRYQIKGVVKHVKQHVAVLDQFTDALGRQGFAVQTTKEDRLVVPTGKSLVGPATALPAGSLDHFKCYKAKNLKNVCLGDPTVKCKRDKADPLIDDCPADIGPCTPGFPKGVVAVVTDQFQTDRTYDIKKLTRLCNPADKNNEDPGAEDLDIHYACYQAKPQKTEPKHTKQIGIRTANQFGDELNETQKEVDLCVPALKNACGDGTRNVGTSEECDDGNVFETDGCTTACTACGNNVTTAPEECDDGNLDSGDGCDANCTTTACGNNIVTLPETCDDGNTDNNDSCPANCIVESCNPDTGSVNSFNVAISSGNQVASVTVLLDYPEGQVSIPGSGGNIPAGIITNLPFLALGSSNDLDHALRQVVASSFPIADGTLFTVNFENCLGASPPIAGDFTCTVLEAFDAGSQPVAATCSVN